LPKQRLPNWLRQTGTLANRSVKKFFEDGCAVGATALAYTTLLALVPITVLSFSIFSSFPASAALFEKARQSLFTHLIPSSGDVIYRYIQTFSENAGKLSFFGVLFLIVMAYSLMRNLEGAFVRVWGTAKHRSSFSRFITFWAVLTLVPVLMAGSIYLSSWFTIIAGLPGVRVFERIMVPFLMTWVAFFFLYRFVPKADVTWWAALTGALVAGTLWEAAKWGFDGYVRQYSSLDKLYGSIGVIPIFLTWLYLTWIFVLYGAEVAFLVQSPKLPRNAGGQDFNAYRSYYALRAMLHVGRSFQKGEPPLPLDEIARRLDLDQALLSPILDRLESAGLVASSAGGELSYLLPKSPETIRAEDVLEATAGNTLAIPGEPGDPLERYVRDLLTRAQDAHLSAWGGITFAALLRDSEDFIISASLKASEAPDKGDVLAPEETEEDGSG
jgi:membrane protein